MITLTDQIIKVKVLEKLLEQVLIQEELLNKIANCFEAIEIHLDYNHNDTLKYIKTNVKLPYVFSNVFSRKEKIETLIEQINDILNTTIDGYIKANIIKIRYYLLQEIKHIELIYKSEDKIDNK